MEQSNKTELPNEEKIDWVFKNMFPYMMKSALAFSKDQDMAEDIVVEACMNMLRWGSLSSLDRPALFTYVKVTVRNTALKMMVCEKSFWKREQAIEDMYVELTESPEEKVMQEEDFRSLVSALSQRDQDLLFLSYNMGFTNKEIAEQTGLKSKTVASYLSKARATLRTLLEEGEGR